MITKVNVNWSEDKLYQMAEEIRYSIIDGKAVSLKRYKALASSVPMEKIRFSLAWILKNEKKIWKFFPDDIIEIISSRLGKHYRFDEYADSFIKAHSDMTARGIGTFLCVSRSAVGYRAKELGITLRSERHTFSWKEDKLTKKYVTNLNFVAQKIGVTWMSVFRRARRLGLHVPRKKSVRYSKKELGIIESADLTKETDEIIASRMNHRTVKSVAKKRRKTGKLRRECFVWRQHPEKWRYLLSKHKTMSYERIGIRLGLTRSQVAWKAWHEGLRKK